MIKYTQAISNDLLNLLLKIIVPALVAVSIKLAVVNKKQRLSWFTVGSSVMSGVGCAYLCSDWIFEYFSERYTSIVVAAIAITGEKIVEWLIYKFNVDLIGDAFLEVVSDWIKNRKK